MRNPIAQIAAVLTAFSPLFAAEPLTLQSAQELLFENNHEIRICDLKQRRAQLEIATARSSFFPRVSLFANYLSQSEENVMFFEGSIPLTDSLSLPFSISQPVGDRDRAETGLEVTWPLLLGLSRLHKVRAAEASATAVNLEYIELRNRLSLQLGLLYFAWELAQRNLSVQETLIKQMSEFHARSRELHQAGIQAYARVLEASSKLEAAKVNLVQAQQTMDSLRLEIADFIRVPDSSIAPAPYGIQALTTRMPHLDTTGMTRRADVMALDIAVTRLDHTRKALRGQRLPGLFVNGSYRYANPGLYMGKNVGMSYATLGASARWELFDGLENWTLRRTIEHDQRIVAKQREHSISRWAKEASLARMQVEAAHRMHDASQVSLDAAHALEQDLRNALAAGVIVSDEYLNALTAVAQAQFAVARAETLRKSALLRLRYALGCEILF